MKKTLGLVAVFLMVALLALSTGLAIADEGSQTWDLDSHAGMSGNNYNMQRDGDPLTPGPVTVPAGECVVFIANEAAAPVDGVTFPISDSDGRHSPWILTLCLGDNWASLLNTQNVRIGYSDGTEGNFTVFAGLTAYVFNDPTGLGSAEFAWQGDAVTVPYQQYLAVEICNAATGDHIVLADGCSRLQSPCADPGYPTPEIATAIFVGLGVLGLAGYVFIRRRQGTAVGA